MAISFGTPVQYLNNTTFATSDTINLSTDATDGDYRIVFAVALPNGTTPAVDSFSITPPTGWTTIAADNSSATSDQYIWVGYRKWVAGDADTLTLSFVGGNLCCVSICVTVHGASSANFLDVATPAVNRPNATGVVTSPAITTASDGAVVIHAMVNDAVQMTVNDFPSGDTVIGWDANSVPSNGWSFAAGYVEVPTATTVPTATWGTNEEHVGITFAIRPILYSLEQTDFRLYDDGTESGSTSLAAQNAAANINRGNIFQLRVGTQAIGDPPAGAFTLQYKERNDPDSEWRDVPPAGA